MTPRIAAPGFKFARDLIVGDQIQMLYGRYGQHYEVIDIDNGGVSHPRYIKIITNDGVVRTFPPSHEVHVTWSDSWRR